MRTYIIFLYILTFSIIAAACTIAITGDGDTAANIIYIGMPICAMLALIGFGLVIRRSRLRIAQQNTRKMEV